MPLKGKKLREAVAEKLGISLDDVHLSKGRAMVKSSYFYRNTPVDKWAERIQEKLGSEFKVVEWLDHWAPWPRDSYYVAYIVSADVLVTKG